MKRGIVMEINKRKAVVLTKDGAFEHVRLHKNQEVEIGAEIVVPASKININVPSLKYAFPIAAAAIVLMVFIYNFSFFKEGNLAVAAYVDIDINPSIEVGVDANLNVIETIPLNDDGQKIIEKISKTEQTENLSVFIDKVVQLADDEGYLQESKNILITTTAIDVVSSNAILEQVESYKENLQKSNITVNTLEGDQETRAKALESGVSTGKYIVYSSQENNEKSELTIEKVKQLSVTELSKQVDIAEIEQIQKNKKDKQNPNKPGNGNNKENGNKNNPGNGNNKENGNKNNPGNGNNKENGNKNNPGNGNNKENGNKNNPGNGNNKENGNKNNPGNGNNKGNDNKNSPGKGNNKGNDNKNSPGKGNNKENDNKNNPGKGNNKENDNKNNPGNGNNKENGNKNNPGKGNNKENRNKDNPGKGNNKENRNKDNPGKGNNKENGNKNNPGNGNNKDQANIDHSGKEISTTNSMNLFTKSFMLINSSNKSE